MAFNDLEFHAVKKEVSQFIDGIRPPANVRDELDIIFHITDQSIEIAELRPVWRGEPGEKIEHSVAKVTYVRSQKAWNLYWMRADMKWHLYESVKTLADALKIVEEDANGCFFG